MKRSDLIRSLKVQFKCMRTEDASAILDTILKSMMQAISNGDKIELRGFGTFQPRLRASKDGYNPSTGKIIHLKPNTTILFKPSHELTKEMNEQ